MALHGHLPVAVVLYRKNLHFGTQRTQFAYTRVAHCTQILLMNKRGRNDFHSLCFVHMHILVVCGPIVHEQSFTVAVRERLAREFQIKPQQMVHDFCPFRRQIQLVVVILVMEDKQITGLTRQRHRYDGVQQGAALDLETPRRKGKNAPIGQN